ncbi:MAG: hypothetical protein WBG70_19335 [Spirulinaceae cyanobacterium]
MKYSKQSKLPKQVAPIQRLSTSVAPSSNNGVEASGIFDLIRQLPIIRTFARK